MRALLACFIVVLALSCVPEAVAAIAPAPPHPVEPAARCENPPCSMIEAICHILFICD